MSVASKASRIGPGLERGPLTAAERTADLLKKGRRWALSQLLGGRHVLGSPAHTSPPFRAGLGVTLGVVPSHPLGAFWNATNGTARDQCAPDASSDIAQIHAEHAAHSALQGRRTRLWDRTVPVSRAAMQSRSQGLFGFDGGEKALVTR